MLSQLLCLAAGAGTETSTLI